MEGVVITVKTEETGEKRKREETEGSGDGAAPTKKPHVHPIDVPYVQEIFCYRASKFLTRCRDCKDKQTFSPEMKDEVCRFQHFRKIIKRTRVSDGKVGFYVQPHGFCNPFQDPNPEDLALWMPDGAHPPEELEKEICLEIIDQLGDQLCALITEELRAPEAERNVQELGWKRLVPGVREMCDVCVTTVFNFHWICKSCGFLACLDCYRSRVEGKKEDVKRRGEGKDEYGWIHCLTRVPFSGKGEEGIERPKVPHNPDDMLLVQIIPGDCLKDFNRLMHEVRHHWGIPQKCGNGNCPESLAAKAVGPEGKGKEAAEKKVEPEPEGQANGNHNGVESKTEEDDDDEDFYFMMEPEDISKGETSDKSNGDHAPETDEKTVNELSADPDDKPPAPQPEEAISEPNNGADQPTGSENNSRNEGISQICHPVITFREEDTQEKFPGLPHSWLCHNTLLKLDDPTHPLNIKAFQLVWKEGQPVVVSKVGHRLDKDLWTPEAFRKEYGSHKHDLINCLSGLPLRDKTIASFWDGFLDVSVRKKSGDGEEMLLKLKDWPPTEDFAKFSPPRFEDLMQALPLKMYTHRRGKLNLAARLPASFSPPDLGPKMYIAYGHGHNLDKGTTVLHLDMSDAVNVMVHVGIPKNCDPNFKRAIEEAVENSDCDEFMKERVRGGELPGALWHIYRPSDAVKIRDLLKGCMVKQKLAIEPNHDPIHDQTFYLDDNLRRRLREEYNVHGFPILQCEGDAVFIPAGAPHQVRNLYNCIKIAEDFVSPENVSHCFKLTEEFRRLSEMHTNHEDKLQIKNIVFHAVKDAMSVLLSISALPPRA